MLLHYQQNARKNRAAQEDKNSMFASPGSNGSLNGAAAGSTNGVEITEVANTPEQGNSPNGSPAPWRPPPVPQSSLNLNKHLKVEASSTV